MKLKTMFWSKDHRVISEKYRNGYDLIEWDKDEPPSLRAHTSPVSGENEMPSEGQERKQYVR